MLSKEENELLERVGPGQPMGEVFRRFWIPALLTEEIPAPDSPPVRVRLLGEDLIAFRDTSGEVGIFDAYCPHRNAPLFFGRNEEGGLRCIYHGWKFDHTGQCIDMPNCLEGPDFKERVRVPAYPTFEGGNMVWVYMGPSTSSGRGPSDVPPKPGFEWLDLPSDHVYVTKYFVQCNYLQTLENEFDIGHSAFLHSTLNPAGSQSNRIIGGNPLVNPLARRGRVANTEVYDTPYGSASGRRTEDGRLALSAHFMMPSFSTAGAVSAPNTNPLNLKLPVDDENTVFFRMKWSSEPLKPEVLNSYLYGKHEFPERIPGTYVTKANKTNDYLQDRALQRNFNFSGMNPYPVQDFAMVEDQRGPVADRSRETLVSSDTYIIHMRRKLLEACEKVLAGEDLEQPWHPEAYHGIRNFKVLSAEEEASQVTLARAARKVTPEIAAGGS